MLFWAHLENPSRKFDKTSIFGQIQLCPKMERWRFEGSSPPLSYLTKIILFCVKRDEEMIGYRRVGFSTGSLLGGGLTLRKKLHKDEGNEVFAEKSMKIKEFYGK